MVENHEDKIDIFTSIRIDNGNAEFIIFSLTWYKHIRSQLLLFKSCSIGQYNITEIQLIKPKR